MTQYNPGFPPPGYPPAPLPPMGMPPQVSKPDFGPRKFPFVAGYILWFLPALWRDAGRRWGGVGFLYLLLLLAISWAVVMAKGHGQFKQFVATEVPKFAKEVPTIDITDGVVTADVPHEPYIIANPDTGDALIVIDTTGATTEPPKPEPSMLLTRDSLMVRNNRKIETHDLSQIKEFHLSSQDVQGFFDKMLGLYWPVFFPVAFITSFVFRFIQVLIFALVGLAIASSVRPPMSFGALMRLAALAITPVILIDTLLWVFWVNIPAWGMLGLLLEVVLFIFMILSNKDPNAPGPSAPYPPPGMYHPPVQPAGMYPPPPPGPGYQPAPYGAPPAPPVPPPPPGAPPRY